MANIGGAGGGGATRPEGVRLSVSQKYIPVGASAEIIFECAKLNLQMTN